MVRPKLGAAEQQRHESRLVAGGRDHDLHRRIGQLRQLVLEQGLHHGRLHRFDQGLGHHFADATPHGDEPAVIHTGVAGAIQKVGVGKRGAVLQQGPGHLQLVAQQQPHQAGGDLHQRRQTARDAKPFLDRRLPQHVDQQVGRHAPFEGVDPAGRQADHVGQSLEQGDTRP